MQQLLRIFYTNGSFFTFVALQLLSVYCIINFNSPQAAIAAETWSVRAGSVQSATERLRGYLDLEEENEAQRAEIARLRELLPEARYRVGGDRDTFADEELSQRFQLLPAHVVNRSPYRPSNSLVIDRGSDAGVQPGQGVVALTGLIGIVDKVTANHARVLSILHQNIRISAGLKGGAFGTLRWEGDDPRYVTITDLPDYIAAAAGDTIYSTGYSNIFPTRQIIGTVMDSEIQPGTGSQHVRARLTNDPLTDNNVYVVQDLFKNELGQLSTDQ